MLIDMPYFMENEDWYYFDYEQGKYVLTDKAPEKAKRSYDEYYHIKKELEKYNETCRDELLKNFMKKNNK